MYAGEGSDQKDGSDASEALDSDVTDWSIEPAATAASADTAAQALLDIELHGPSGNPRRPNTRRTSIKRRL